MNRRIGLATILAVFFCAGAPLGLAGCFATDLQRPAPLIHCGGDEGPGAKGAHTVTAGENLYSIATRYKLALQDIIAENRLSAPFLLTTGQRLRLPAPRSYTVRSGDSLYEIARLFDTGESALARINDLRPPYAVHAGQVLRLPSSAPPPTPARAARLPDRYAAQRPSFPSSPPLPPNRPAYDAAYPPAPAGGYSPAAPGGEAGGIFSEVLARALGGGAGASSGGDGAGASAPLPGRKPGSRGDPDSAASSSARAPHGRLAAILPAPPPRAGTRFLWPVRGRVLSAYGPKKGGLHNDGINIDAARGTPVRAADNGVVVYAGSGLQGYGNLVLIRHESRWMTAYAHMEKISVRKGDTVRRGQTLGAVGSTGSVTAPQLHFEVRRGSEALNPQAFLERS